MSIDEPPAGGRRRAHGRTGLSVAAWEAMFRGYNVVMRDLEESGAFGPLTPREYDVLLHLTRGPRSGMRQRELLQETMLPQPSVSRTLGRLEEQGLIRFEFVAEDRRGRLIVLTDAGRAVQRSAGRTHVVALRAAFADVGEDELRVLRIVGENLERAARGTDGPEA